MKNGNHYSKLKKLLRKSGCKATPARLEVLAHLADSRSPMSAQDIIDRLQNKADQATVYRIIKILKEKGLIRQIDLRLNHAQYELAKKREHHHLVCVACSRIEDVRNCGVEAMHETILSHSRHFLKINQHALEFYGVCKNCAATRM
jgi:Fur family ferric uptake transcriptional regulator